MYNLHEQLCLQMTCEASVEQEMSLADNTSIRVVTDPLHSLYFQDSSTRIVPVGGTGDNTTFCDLLLLLLAQEIRSEQIFVCNSLLIGKRCTKSYVYTLQQKHTLAHKSAHSYYYSAYPSTA